MRVVVATCTCLILVRLAAFQKSNSCKITLEKSECKSFLNFSLTVKKMKSHNYRILIYSYHFKTLNKTEKICLLKKIFGFYKNINSKVYTKEVPKEKISALEDHLIKFTNTCLNCTECRDVRNIKPLMKCHNYSTSMVLNQTQIMHCQEWLINKANKKRKKLPKQVQEKTIYELDILKNFVTEAN